MMVRACSSVLSTRRSQKGRDAEYRAILGDGGRLRGTWQAFELADGVAPSGSWNAVRRR